MKKRLLLGLLLFTLGLAGVFSLLLVELPTGSIPKEVLDQFSPQTLKLLVLINPLILLFTSIFLGIFTFNKVGLKLPILSKLVGLSDQDFNWKEIVIYGIALGTLSGIMIVLVSHFYKLAYPTEFALLNKDIHLHVATRLLYGGITEEILTRFGLMSLFVYLFSLVFKSPSNLKFWLGIFVSSILFALGHLPVVFQTVSNPGFATIVYILIGNSIAGVLFGWLYWRKGLESAMIGHMVAHICMLAIGNLLPQ
jgi:membrane protease YdiL (CAAX protease family)